MAVIGGYVDRRSDRDDDDNLHDDIGGDSAQTHYHELGSNCAGIQTMELCLQVNTCCSQS